MISDEPVRTAAACTLALPLSFEANGNLINRQIMSSNDNKTKKKPPEPCAQLFKYGMVDLHWA